MAKRPRAARPPAPLDPHAFLRDADPALAAVIDRVGPCPLADALEGAYSPDACFEALVRAIVSQQLSTKAAATIAGRVAALGAGGFPTPTDLARIPYATLREAGLSDAKARSVADLAERVLDGRLPLEGLGALEDEAVIETLVAVRGIGRWTAEMFLMFRLRRPDVLSTGDLGLQKGMQGLYRLRKLPTKATMEKRAALWKPYRTVACWYLWRVAETMPPAVRRASPRAAAAASSARGRARPKATAAR